jgi:hypothetical protein
MVPFHDLWVDGGETEKRPPWPQCVIEPAKNHGRYFRDTTLMLTREMETGVRVGLR